MKRLALRFRGMPGAVVCLLALALLNVPEVLGEEGTIVAIPGSAAPLVLDECVAEAFVSNAGIRAERQRRGELGGQKKQAVSIGLPTIDLTGSWRRGRDPSFALDETFSGDGGGEIPSGPCSTFYGCLAGLSFIPSPEDIPAQTFWRTSVNARWELRPGLIYNAIGAAGLGIDRQEFLIADAEHRLVEGVLSAYYSVIMAGEQLAAFDADLVAKQEFLDVTRHRFHLGLSTALDTLRAAVAYSNLVPLRRSAAQNLRDAGSNVNVLMGRSPLTPLTVDANVPLEAGTIDADAAAARVPLRPDIRQLELYEGMLRKNRGAQKAEHRPYVSADASYGYVTGEMDALMDEGHDFWSASVMLTVPIFDGLLTKGKVQEAAAMVERTRLQWEEAVRQARLEVLSTIGDLEAARANLEAASLNLTAAESALEQLTLRYELGKADYLSVLNIQADRLLARSNYIEARNRVLTLTASLKRSLGFSPSVPLAEVRHVISVNIDDPSGSGR